MAFFANAHKGDMRIDSGIDSAESTVSIYAEEQSSVNSLSDSVLTSSLSISNISQNSASDSRAVSADTSTQSNNDSYVDTPNNNDNNNNNNNNNYYYPPTDNTSSDTSSDSSSNNGANFLDNYRFTELDDGTIRLDEYLGSETGVIEIPAEYKGKPITVLASGFFTTSTCYGYHIFIDKIIIPDSVTTIEENALCISGCDLLEEIHIGKNVRNIADGGLDLNAYANDIFEDEDDMIITKITVDPDNEWFTEYDGGLYTKDLSEVVWYPGAIEEVYLPDTVRTIRSKAFIHSALKKVRIPNGVTELRTDTFFECSFLHDIMLPKSLETIRSEAIVYDCFDSEYAFVALPLNVKTIEDNFIIGVGSVRCMLIADDADINLDAQCVRTDHWWCSGVYEASSQEEWDKMYEKYFEKEWNELYEASLEEGEFDSPYIAPRLLVTVY